MTSLLVCFPRICAPNLRVVIFKGLDGSWHEVFCLALIFILVRRFFGVREFATPFVHTRNHLTQSLIQKASAESVTQSCIPDPESINLEVKASSVWVVIVRISSSSGRLVLVIGLPRTSTCLEGSLVWSSRIFLLQPTDSYSEHPHTRRYKLR